MTYVHVEVIPSICAAKTCNDMHIAVRRVSALNLVFDHNSCPIPPLSAHSFLSFVRAVQRVMGKKRPSNTPEGSSRKIQKSDFRLLNFRVHF